MQGKKYFSLLSVYGIISTLFILSFLSSNSIYAQEYSKLDSLKMGIKYKFILFDETEIVGLFVKMDSIYVEVSNRSVLTRIRKDDIFSVSRETEQSKFNLMLSFGGGVTFPGGDFFSNNENAFEKSYCFQIAGSFYLSSGKLIRLDLGYSRLKRKTNPYEYYTTGYNTTYSGGDKNLFSFKVDFLAGEINTESNIIAYGLAGIGLHYTYVREYSYTSIWSYDTTQNTYTYKYPAEKRMNAVFSIGGGFGYKIKRKFGIYIEAQYNMITYAGYILFGPGTTYIPLRLGMIYFIY